MRVAKIKSIFAVVDPSTKASLQDIIRGLEISEAEYIRRAIAEKMKRDARKQQKLEGNK